MPGRCRIFREPEKLEFTADAAIKARYLRLAEERHLLPGQFLGEVIDLLESSTKKAKAV